MLSFFDLGSPPDFVLPGNVESASLNIIVEREGFSDFKQKSQAFNLNVPLTGRVQSLPQPSNEDRMMLVESFASRGCVGSGISLVTVS